MRLSQAHPVISGVLLMMAAVILPLSAQAAVVEGLYEVSRTVSDQGDAQRRKAFREGLSEVLRRVTGSQGATANEGVRKAFANPIVLVQQYRYEQFESKARPGVQGLRVNMVFDPAAVENLLERNGLPVWGRERPASLIWLAVDDGRRRLLSTEDGGDYFMALQKAALRRGIPLLFPLMDLEERRAVRVSDIWGGFSDGAVQASSKYATASVLMVRLQRTAGGWRAQWTQQAFGEARSWETSGSLFQTLNAGVDTLADDLASRFVVADGVVADVRMNIEEVVDLAAYGQLMRYLHGLSLVSDLRLLRASGSRLQLLARVRGGAQALVPVIGLGTTLSPTGGAQDGVLGYRLEVQ